MSPLFVDRSEGLQEQYRLWPSCRRDGRVDVEPACMLGNDGEGARLIRVRQLQDAPAEP
jgi:hypothetical protein